MGVPQNSDWIAEYNRTYDAVIRAAALGYHLPYNNLHSDDLSEAYAAGFHDALDDLQVPA